MNRKEIEELAKKLCKIVFNGDYYGVDYDDIIRYVADSIEEWLGGKELKSK